MSDQDEKTIFETKSGETQTPEATTPKATDTATATFELPPEVAEYVGPGKKYANVQEALKALPHAQKYIDTLKSELDEVRPLAEKATTLEEALAQIKAEGPTKESPSKEIDPAVIESLLDRKLTEREQKIVSQRNIDSVTSTLDKHFGSSEKAIEAYTKAAAEAGLSIAEMNKLASRSPNAVFKLVGMESKQPTPVSRTTSSTKTEAFQAQPETPSAKLNNQRTNLLEAWKNSAPTEI